jgi:hypothetical protein
MVAANLQKVEETLGRVDAVFFAGDLVNIPDRASEWFDDSRGCGFFPCLQGNTRYALERNGRTVSYRGGEIIQHAPLFATLGNHEVMGRFAATAPLGEQFNQPVPRSAAVELYEANADLFNPSGDPTLRRQWIIDNSFNSDTYEALFSLPVTQVPNPRSPRDHQPLLRHHPGRHSPGVALRHPNLATLRSRRRHPGPLPGAPGRPGHPAKLGPRAAHL